MKITEYIAVGSAIVGVCAAVFGLYTQVENRNIQKSINNFDRKIKENSEERADKELENKQKDIGNKYDLAVYQEVVQFILLDKSNMSSEVSKIRGEAIIALVLSSTTEGLKKTLISVISSAKNVSPETTVKAEQVYENISAVKPNSETALPSNDSFPPPPNFQQASRHIADYKIAVFYCEDGSNKLIAESLLTELKSIPEVRDVKISWDLKQLLNIVNSSPGYGINSNQIRYNNQDGESFASTTLKNYFENLPSAKSKNINFNLVQVSQRTPNYLSAFICGN